MLRIIKDKNRVRPKSKSLNYEDGRGREPLLEGSMLYILYSAYNIAQYALKTTEDGNLHTYIAPFR